LGRRGKEAVLKRQKEGERLESTEGFGEKAVRHFLRSRRRIITTYSREKNGSKHKHKRNRTNAAGAPNTDVGHNPEKEEEKREIFWRA